jgi:hypothetical protein
MNSRRVLAVGVMLACALVIVVAQVRGQGYDQTFYDRQSNRTADFVRHPDTTCGCISDTIAGPTVWCLGAKQVLWKVRANSGRCSLMTVQVSNNDTNWVAAAGGVTTDVTTSGMTNVAWAKTDSLNRGGAIHLLTPTFVGTITPMGGIPWRYTRLFVTLLAGVTSNNDCTILCRGKCDSLRWSAYVQY